jgi:hypothetical protein
MMAFIDLLMAVVSQECLVKTSVNETLDLFQAKFICKNPQICELMSSMIFSDGSSAGCVADAFGLEG